MSIKKINNVYRRFKRDIRGNFGVMAALTTLGLISSVGFVVDTQRFYQHADRAQSVADAAGLASALYVANNNDMPPTTDESRTGAFIEGETYPAADLGFDLSFGEEISFSVDYDGVNREVTVTTEGTVTPIILQLIGKTKVNSKRTSVTKYADPADANAASVLFVLDNSGSMWFDDLPEDPVTLDIPDNAVKRIDALKTNVNRLNAQFRNIGGDNQQGGNNRFLRTGLLTYNSGQLTRRFFVRNPWGGISIQEEVTVPEEGTQGPIKG